MARGRVMYVNSNLDQIADSCQRLDEVGALLEAASPRTREVYVSHRAGYTYAEIMHNLNIAAITVKRHFARASRIVTQYKAGKKGEQHGDLEIDRPPVRIDIAAPKRGIDDRKEIGTHDAEAWRAKNSSL